MSVVLSDGFLAKISNGASGSGEHYDAAKYESANGQ